MANVSGEKFSGWRMVLAAFLIGAAGMGLLMNCNTAFVKPVTDALGFTRAQFTLCSTIMSIIGMFMLPVYGEIFKDPKRMRKTLFLCSMVSCTIPIGFSFSNKLWQFYALSAVWGLVTGGITMMCLGTIVNNWFHEKKGIATGIAFSGSSILPAIMISVVTKIIEQYGWQWGYRFTSILAVLIFVPTILIILRVHPDEMGQKPLGAGKPVASGEAPRTVEGATRAQALKSPAFWSLAIAIVIVSFVGGGMQIHMMPYLDDIGYPTAYSSMVASAVMLMMMVGKLGLGVIFDKFGALRGSLIGGVSALAGAILLLAAKIPVVPWICTLFIGVVCASGSVPTNYLTSAYFGEKEFTRIYPLVTMAGSLGFALGSPVSGMIYDLTGSYNVAWQAYIVFGAMSVVMFVVASRSSATLLKKVAMEDAGTIPIRPALDADLKSE